MGRKFEIVKPKLAANWRAGGKALYSQHQQCGGTRGLHFRVNFLPEVGIVERIAGIEWRSRVGISQNDLGPARSFKVCRLVVRREFVSGCGAHWNQLLNPGVVDAWAFEGEGKRAMTLAEVARIEQWLDTDSIDVSPVEASVQDVEAEIAVHHQVVLRRQIGREAESAGSLLPGRLGRVGTVRCNEITHV